MVVTVSFLLTEMEGGPVCIEYATPPSPLLLLAEMVLLATVKTAGHSSCRHHRLRRLLAIVLFVTSVCVLVMPAVGVQCGCVARTVLLLCSIQRPLHFASAGRPSHHFATEGNHCKTTTTTITFTDTTFTTTVTTITKL